MDEKYRLTNTESSIIKQLEIDARTPLSRIGKKVRMSQQRVSYALDSLIKKGVIEEFYTLIDYSKFDVINFRVYFKVSYTTQEEFRELISYLKKEPSTSWIATCGGKYDLICTFFASNPSNFNKTLKGIMRKFPEQLQNYTVLTTIVTKYFGREYLLSGISNPSREIIIGGDRIPEKFEDKDLQIISHISENARISAVEIANKVQLTPKTIIERIKKLKSREVIKGFRPALNIRKMDNIDFILVIRSHNVIPEIEDKLINYLKMQPNVVSVIKTLGEWDLEIQMEVKSWYEYRKIVIDIREKFKSLIQEIESIPIYKNYHKINYFPGFLVEQG
ncbi:Lrp/AsnC family transcriptional regulator [Candidatus Woesearchaeota archaeon]|nr:Lrp/AsnC family transcriptional regulator [Candidatus Woesearchaeota archaeon]